MRSGRIEGGKAIRLRHSPVGVIIMLALLSVPLIATAQQATTAPRLGVLTRSTARGLDAFRYGLQELGYVEGQNLVMEWRYAERPEQAPALAAELVRLGVDVLVTHGPSGVRAAMAATHTIPIVVGRMDDADEQGFVTTLGQPGGNVTGLSFQTGELSGKWLELLTEAVPGASRFTVLWTHSNVAALAAKRSTTTIPIVVGVAGDLIGQGLVASLARPGGNLTGMEHQDVELAGKRLELLKEALPRLSRVAVLVSPTNPAHQGAPQHIEREARALGVQLQRVEAPTPEAFEAAFAAMGQGGAEALMIMDYAIFAQHRHRLFELALRHRLPTIAAGRQFAEAGSLLAYGAYPHDLCQRSATLVDKILKGATPADLPVEQPTTFKLVINLKTATALGLTLPPPFLAQADEVIR